LTELAFNEWNKKEHLKRMKAEPHEKQRVAMAATGGKPASTSGHKAVMKVNGTGHAAAAGPSVNAEGAAEEKKEE
jgi:hypothetical protein